MDDFLPAFKTGRTLGNFPPGIAKIIKNIYEIVKVNKKDKHKDENGNQTSDKEILEKNTGTGVKQPIVVIKERDIRSPSIFNKGDSTGVIIREYSNDSTEVVNYVVGGDTLSKYGYKER